MNALLTPQAAVTIGGNSYPYTRRWSGQRLLPRDGYLAFDTETEVVDLKRHIPRLALASATAGETESCLIHPDDVGRFVLAHRGLRFVCHNAAFDFWVIEHHLRRRGEEEARSAWWAAADDGRLHDTMLLDALVRLATDDTFPRPLPLDAVAREYAGLEVDKNDPYRLRYAEIISADWAAVEEGFFVYAIKDSIVTLAAHRELRRRALALAERHQPGELWPDAGERFGPLTETLQVKKAIALAAVGRNGMAVDLEWARRHEADLRRRLHAAVADVRGLCADLY